MNQKENLGKFDAKSHEGIFLGYSLMSKAYRVYNKTTLVVEEAIHVRFVETNALAEKGDDDDVGEASKKLKKLAINDGEGTNEDKEKDTHDEPQHEALAQDEGSKEDDNSKEDDEVQVEVAPLPPSYKFIRDHPSSQIIGKTHEGVRTRGSIRNEVSCFAFLSQFEPRKFQEAENDEFWMMAMQEELNQFERSKVWKLVPRPSDRPIIGTK
nr:hypothetical protein [Serratia marcescens]